VRKHAKDTGGEGGAGVEVEALDDGGDGTFLNIHILAQKVNPLNLPPLRQDRFKGAKDYH